MSLLDHFKTCNVLHAVLQCGWRCPCMSAEGDVRAGVGLRRSNRHAGRVAHLWHYASASSRGECPTCPHLMGST